MEPEPASPFELIETMVCTHRIVYLDTHLERLKRSAAFFKIPLQLTLLRETLTRIGEALRHQGRHKVRLTVRESGEHRIQISPIQKHITPYKSVCISPHIVDSSNVYFYHKTTRRTLYDTEYERIARDGYYEILFVNEKGQLTEGSRSNLFARIGNTYYTPPLPCGVLPGVYRTLLLNRCPQIQENVLTIQDLKSADRLYLCNAVSGLQRIHHIDFSPPS